MLIGLAQQPADGVRGFLNLVLHNRRVPGGFGILCGTDDAVGDVVLEQADADGVQGLVDRGHLREDVDAVLLLLHHPLEPAGLAPDATEPLEVGVLARDVAVGAVVGATYPVEAARLRQLMPRTYFLVPGYGAQGAGAAEVQTCFTADGYGALINSSRVILYAYRQPTYQVHGEEHFPEAARAAVLAMQEELAVAPRPSS